MIRIIASIFLLSISCASESNRRVSTMDAGGRAICSTLPSAKINNRYITGEQYLEISDVKKLSEDMLSFNIQWDASWREGNEYDAAWIFIKSRGIEGIWQHMNIMPGTSEVVSNSSSDNAKADIQDSPDKMGMIINRKNDGQGNNNWTVGVGLEENTEFSSSEFRVFGLEMVHVASGGFELGTLKGESQRKEVLTPGAGGAPYDPFFTFKRDNKNNYGGVFKVSSEDPIDIGKEDGNLYWIDANIPGTNTFSGIPEGRLDVSFPKGYDGFFAMKYEMSQAEYCDFLNSLTPDQQSNRDITSQMEYDRPISDYRNAIYKENGVFKTTRPHRPCNFISWKDGLAYADWVGLRHMTEMEFEKASRGPNKAIYREYVWGDNEIEVKSNMRYSTTIKNKDGSLSEEENGNEITDGNNHTSMFSYFNFQDVCVPGSRFYDPDCLGCRTWEGGDGGRGPLRKGIFGTTSQGDRIKAGATYYGLMDMGGNLQEPVVTVGHPNGRRFQGTHGDGILTENGEATNLDWIPHGGCWKFHENHARTSDRFKGLRTNEDRRASHIGFRGVRSVHSFIKSNSSIINN